jgi:hypothetical protein
MKGKINDTKDLVKYLPMMWYTEEVTVMGWNWSGEGDRGGFWE